MLSIHAGYRCQRRGVCCRAGWPVPVEATQLAPLDAALAAGALRPRMVTPGPALERVAGAPAETPVRLARPDGICAFFDDGGRPGCRIHAALGHAALPLACRQFPRVTMRDPRGASVTLSHYCPTAASQLDVERGVEIVTGAPRFPSDGEYVGLDARDGMPPLLRPDMAMDWEAWWELERLSVEWLGNCADSLDASVARLRGVVEDVRAWSPADGPLIERVRGAWAGAAPLDRQPDAARLVTDVHAAVPADLGDQLPQPGGERPPPSPGAQRRFLTAHAFASWTAHLAVDLRAWLRSIEAAQALLLTGHTIGEADLLLRHLADPHALARRWARA